MFLLLHDVMHGMEALIYSNYSREAAAAVCLALLWTDCQRYTLVPPFSSGANPAPVSVHTLPLQCHYSAGTDVGRGSLRTTSNTVFDTMSLT